MTKKRKFGIGGSGITDDYWEYGMRIRIGPARLPPDEIDAETFKEELDRQGMPPIPGEDDISFKPPTAKEFMELLANPNMQTTYKTRAMMERIGDALEHFKRQEFIWWINQQMSILRFIRAKKWQDKSAAYKLWARSVFMPQVAKAYKRIKKQDPKKAKAFLEFAWEFIESNEPKPKQDGSVVIIEKVMKMIISGETYDLQRFQQELAPALKPKKK